MHKSGKQDKEFSWEEADKLFPGAREAFEMFGEDENNFTFEWSRPFLKKNGGIYAYETQVSVDGKCLLYFGKVWKYL